MSGQIRSGQIRPSPSASAESHTDRVDRRPGLLRLVFVVLVERLQGGQGRVVALDGRALLAAERAVPDGHLQAGAVLRK